MVDPCYQQLLPTTHYFSPSHPAPVHQQYRSAHVVSGPAGQKDRRALKVLGLSPAAGRDATEDGLAPLRVILQGLGVVGGGDVAGGDGVDLYALPGPVVRRVPSSADRWPPRSGVAGYRDAALEGEQGGGEDDFAATARSTYPGRTPGPGRTGRSGSPRSPGPSNSSERWRPLRRMVPALLTRISGVPCAALTFAMKAFRAGRLLKSHW